jgi:hypothetical protein
MKRLIDPAKMVLDDTAHEFRPVRQGGLDGIVNILGVLVKDIFQGCHGDEGSYSLGAMSMAPQQYLIPKIAWRGMENQADTSSTPPDNNRLCRVMGKHGGPGKKGQKFTSSQ